MSYFTEDQLKELETLFGLKRVEEEALPVRDGYVNKETKVWWRGRSGPEHVVAKRHWVNIQKYPELYQLKEPTRKTVYAD